MISFTFCSGEKMLFVSFGRKHNDNIISSLHIEIQVVYVVQCVMSKIFINKKFPAPKHQEQIAKNFVIHTLYIRYT